MREVFALLFNFVAAMVRSLQGWVEAILVQEPDVGFGSVGLVVGILENANLGKGRHV